MKIMAPVGDVHRLQAALKGGADELYMGLRGYGARRFAGNFSVDEMIVAIREAHLVGATVHLTLNTIMPDDEMNAVYDDLAQLVEKGLDAVIVQDIGVARWIHRCFPGLPLHASTQLSLSTAEELEWLKAFGFKRAVLARELSLREIEAIRAKTDLEIEVFAAGALCLCCSGKCYLSSFIGGRSGNRGSCAQPCRQQYVCDNRSRDNSPKYYLSLADQWQGEKEIRRLTAIGIDSIKIEGRMKSPAYVFESVRYYRSLIDQILREQGKELPVRLFIKKNDVMTEARGSQIASIFNRGYGSGYFYGSEAPLNHDFSSNFGVEIGRVVEEAVLLTGSVRNGDGIVYLTADKVKLSGQNVSWIEVPSSHKKSTWEKVDEARAGERVRFEFSPPTDAVYVYKTSDFRLQQDITHDIKQIRRTMPIKVRLVAREGLPLELTLSEKRGEVTVKSTEPIEKASKRSTGEADLWELLDRFGDTTFDPHSIQTDLDNNLFIPKSLVNQLRQQAIVKLEELIESKLMLPAEYTTGNTEKFSVSSMPSVGKTTLQPYPAVDSKNDSDFPPEPKIAMVVRTKLQFDICRKFAPMQINFFAPPVSFDRYEPIVDEVIGLPLAGSIADALRLEERKIDYSTDWTFNIGNIESLLALEESLPHLKSVCLSPELSENACKKIVLSYHEQTQRGGNRLLLGLPVYGRLAGMFTRRTLFDEYLVQLVNPEGRKIIVACNSLWYEKNPPQSGSTIYKEEPLDLLVDLPRIKKMGLDFLRFDFTTEMSAEMLTILKRLDYPTNTPSHSYGFERGIF